MNREISDIKIMEIDQSKKALIKYLKDWSEGMITTKVDDDIVRWCMHYHYHHLTAHVCDERLDYQLNVRQNIRHELGEYFRKKNFKREQDNLQTRCTIIKLNIVPREIVEEIMLYL